MVLGTRPEAIKLAPLVLALRAQADVRLHVHCTGQHGAWLDEIFEWFGVPPDTRAQLPQGHTLAQSFGRVLEQTSELLEQLRPAAVVVQGDTTSALAASLAAFYARCPVVHVEAGLRTGDLEHPWPEEAHRRALTLLCAYHGAPTARDARALVDEGVAPERVAVVGNTVIDALKWTQAKLALAPSRPLPSALKGAQRWVVVTLHRRENFQDDAHHEMIFAGLRRAARARPGVQWVLPAHANPEVVEAQRQGVKGVDNLHVIASQAYPDFVRLLGGARGVVTDSGGIQEEAQALGKPVVVVRQRTERRALLERAGGRLAHDAQTLEAAIDWMLQSTPDASFPYGEGDASARCVEAIRRWLHDED